MNFGFLYVCLVMNFLFGCFSRFYSLYDVFFFVMWISVLIGRFVVSFVLIVMCECWLCVLYCEIFFEYGYRFVIGMSIFRNRCVLLLWFLFVSVIL